LSIKLILQWADEHHRRTGRYPTVTSGTVCSAPEENWQAINLALRVGVRGLPAGDSLHRLLCRRRRVE
jgi:hypothetical protein